ncbi:MAG: cell division protein FtsZ [Ignavibacteriales bacterium]|nr:cell division protein FtsZ [Ignavibacteriales bacterium]
MAQFATIDRTASSNANLKVIGIGGGGCNALESMIKRTMPGVEFIAVNTDLQALEKSSASQKVQVGVKITRGLGAGADPIVGRKSIEEDRDRIAEILRGSDMVFLTAGMGGGTGTGGLPVIASIAKSLDILTVAIVTKPFKWEGKIRMMNAEKGIHELKQYVDSLIVIPNEKLIKILEPSGNFFQTLDKANEVLYEATRGIADIINVGGFINVDFADVRSVMAGSGQAIMGCGIASGENRAIEAAQKAISSPFLEDVNIRGAKSVLLNVTGSSNLTMEEITQGNDVIFEAAGEDVNIIFGCVCKEEMNDYISYTVIATGFEEKGVKDNKHTGPQGMEPVAADTKGGYKQRPFIKNSYADEVRQMEPIGNTPIKIKPPKASFNEEPEKNQIGFDFEKFKSVSFNDVGTEEQKRKKAQEEDDTTSEFLRMIMD